MTILRYSAADRCLARRGIGRILVGLRAQFIVDIERIDLNLLIDALNRFAMSVEFPDLHG